jgi:F-type H+-transporting ATPase subunit b
VIIHLDATLPIEVATFLLFFWLLKRLFYQPVAEIARQRTERIEAGLRAAEESQRRAEETQRAVQRQLDEARAEARTIIAAAGKDAEAERQALMAQAREEAEALLQQARIEIQRERQDAVDRLRREAGSLAVLAASRVVGGSLDTVANRALADRVIADLAEEAVAEVGGVH